ncbi:MAG: type II toxin-antitoxin system HicB family antitoxin [Anaerocolumna sp.]
MATPKAIKVKPIEDYRLLITFNNGEQKIYNTAPLLKGDWFGQLKDPAISIDEACKNAKEALGLHLWGMEQDGEEIPEPSPLNKITLEPGDLPVLVEVFMPVIRDKVKNHSVTKNLTLPAWLAAEGDERNVNFSKLFQNALMEYLEINEQPKQP